MSTCTRCMRDVGTGRFCPSCGTELPPADPAGDPHVGQIVAGKYLIHHLLGRGGMGVVYKASHLSLDRPVAIKMLDRALLSDPTVVARFHREARAASRLNHPNSISVIDFGQADDGTLFMALEFLPGRNLARVIADEAPLQTRRVVKIGSQLLAALTEAHALGILHCDIKPENVMLETRHDEADVVKVLDFGIAKLRDGSGGPRLTQEGMSCGTPGYASPEQARGEELDASSDLYSTGVLLYELASGRLPYEAATPGALVAKMLVEPPVPLRRRRPDLAVAPSLEAVIMRALAVDRQARFTTAEAFRRELLACLSTAERPAPPPTRAQATAVFDATPPAHTDLAGRPGRSRTPATPGPAAPPAASQRSTPHRPPAAGPSRGAVRETAGALGIMLVSVAAALLLGAGVWHGLDWARTPAVATATPTRLAAAIPAATPPLVPPGPPPARTATAIPDPAVIATAPEAVVTVLGTPGARITVDGRDAGRSPRELRLAPGSHRLQLSHPSAGDAEETIQVVAGERRLWSPASTK